MRTLLVNILVITMVLVLLPNWVFAFQNEPDGFRSYKWGTPLSEFKDAIIRESQFAEALGLIVVNRRSENLYFGGVNVSEINYLFHNDSLSSVTLMVYSETDFQKLKQFCFESYGKREMSQPDKEWKITHGYDKYERYTWKGETSIIDMIYNPDYQGSYYGQLAYSSAEYMNRK